METKRVLLFGALLFALAGASLALSCMHLGQWALPVALFFGAAKATIILLFFMELLRERASIVLAFLAGALMLVILISLMLTDLMTRLPPPLPPA